jgi:carboxymethylenebutenolidase
VTLAVDLYRDLPGRPSPDDPGAWMRALSDPDVLDRVREGVAFLRGHPAVSGGIGVTGFCMGGSFALLAAASVEGLGAAVPFYGVLSYRHGLYASDTPLDPGKKPIEPLEAAREIACPVLAFFGAEDVFIPASDVDALRARLAAARAPSEVVVYQGAGHAFVNDTRPAAYRAEAAADAWARMVAFFRARL